MVMLDDGDVFYENADVVVVVADDDNVAKTSSVPTMAFNDDMVPL